MYYIYEVTNVEKSKVFLIRNITPDNVVKIYKQLNKKLYW